MLLDSLVLVLSISVNLRFLFLRLDEMSLEEDTAELVISSSPVPVKKICFIYTAKVQL